MSNLRFYNQLNDQYDQIHRVGYLLQKKDLECVKEFENWLSKTESILNNYKAQDKNLIKQFIGQFKIERSRKDRIMTKKNRELNAVSQLMEQTKQAVLEIIEPMSEKIEQCNVLIKGMLRSKNFSYNHNLNYRDYIHAVWRTLLNDNFTKLEAQKVRELIGDDDALELISKNLKPKKL